MRPYRKMAEQDAEDSVSTHDSSGKPTKIKNRRPASSYDVRL